MKQILLFGAGKSATVLIDYLLDGAPDGGYNLLVADADGPLAASKVRGHTHGHWRALDILDAAGREDLITGADLVISLLPPALHFPVAEDCLRLGKHLLTASYVDERLQELAPAVERAGLLFLCEMGLDPGLDHMSACRLIHHIQSEGGQITSFKSHCGGLVAPESDDNPWHYKVSWNPRNVVNAGKAGARYLEDGEEIYLGYKDLFAKKRLLHLPGLDTLCWYPNRDSIAYLDKYGLQGCRTFVRTTLRHPDFMYGWNNLIELGLTSETPSLIPDEESLAVLFKHHLQGRNFEQWLDSKLKEQLGPTRNLLEQLASLDELQGEAQARGVEPVEEFMVVTDEGSLEEIEIDDLKEHAASLLAEKMHDANLILKQLFHLGLQDETSVPRLGHIAPADLLQWCLEHKLPLSKGDHDLVVMLHEIEYEVEGQPFAAQSLLVEKGLNDHHTAMARTVGLPLGVAAKLILSGALKGTGVQVPIQPAIYEPMLKALAGEGIHFVEVTGPRA